MVSGRRTWPTGADATGIKEDWGLKEFFEYCFIHLWVVILDYLFNRSMTFL